MCGVEIDPAPCVRATLVGRVGVIAALHSVLVRTGLGAHTGTAQLFDQDMFLEPVPGDPYSHYR